MTVLSKDPIMACGIEVKERAVAADLPGVPSEGVPWGPGETIAGVTASFLAAGLVFITSLAPQIISDLSEVDLGVAAWAFPVGGMLLGYLLFPLIVWVFAVKVSGGTLRHLGVSRFPPSAGFLAASLLLVSLAFNFSYEKMLALFGVAPSEDQVTVIVNFFGNGAAGLLTAVLIIALLGPIAEELLFRGFLQPVLSKSCGRRWAILLNGAVFSLVHVNAHYFVPIMVLGWLLAWLYERNRSLGPPVILHVLNNLAAIIALVATGKLGI